MNWPETAAAGLLGDGRFASATEQPESLEALRDAVRRRVAEGYAIYPQGGRTALDYGGIPRQPGVAIDTNALARVIDYPHADMTITIEAGMTLERLQATLADHGQRLPLDAPQPRRATLGAIFATNTSGPRRFGAGRPRDFLIGVSFVNGDGEVIKGGGRVVKNVAGYDFPRLLTGSMGTLGIIAQMTLKVRPTPARSALVWAVLATAEQAAATLEALNTSATRPCALELLNRPAAGLVGGPLGLPAGEWQVAIGLEDNAPAVAWQVEQLKGELAGCDLAALQDDAAALWTALAEFQAAQVGPLSFTANLRPSRVAAFAAQLDPARWAVQAHAGNGVVRGHLLVDEPLDAIAAQLDALRAQAAADGGNLVLPRCPTAWKARLPVWGTPRPDWALAERVKQALDPRGVMNPGRFVGKI